MFNKSTKCKAKKFVRCAFYFRRMSNVEFVSERLHQTFDRTDEHLENVEKQIEEIHRSFCCQLCCSAKSTRRKSPIEKKSKEKVRSSFVAEENPILTNENLRMIDENLQKLQHFNRLIDEEIHDQIETLV